MVFASSLFTLVSIKEEGFWRSRNEMEITMAVSALKRGYEQRILHVIPM